jgi:tRNA threonylcarbamoyladenosine biosynthesis protein TsaB
MVSCSELLTRYGTVLVVDASSTRMQLGLLRQAEPPLWQSSTDEAGRALFTLAEACLREAGLRLDQIGAFAFCAGPGSMLGVRTVAMALRTWQILAPRPVFAFSSLNLLAREIGRTDSARPLAVITDARRDTWNLVRLDTAGLPSPVARVPTADVASLPPPVYCPSAFRSFAPAPANARDFPYDVASALQSAREAPLFSPSNAPDAFQHEAPEYKKWSAQVHSAVNATK